MQISKPSLILDEAIARNNIRKMAEKARKHSLRFKPHFKTHQSAEIGEWFRDEGVSSITVSSVTMAKYFSLSGWNDITIAFPYNPRELTEYDGLAQNCRELNILVENEESLYFIERYQKNKLGAYIKIDTGSKRTGVLSHKIQNIEILVSKIHKSEKIDFKGFLTHAGHTYHASGKEEILKIHNESINQMKVVKEKFGGEVSIGDTPSCSIADDFSGADEIRPGNFVFYDWMQYSLGACSLDDIAVYMLCPVVAKHPERTEIVIYGGAVHFSKDNIKEKGIKIFGRPIELNGSKIGLPVEKSYLKYISQEHGVIKADEEYFKKAKIGGLAAVYPVHSCLTANLMKSYLLESGKKIKMFS